MIRGLQSAQVEPLDDMATSSQCQDAFYLLSVELLPSISGFICAFTRILMSVRDYAHKY